MAPKRAHQDARLRVVAQACAGQGNGARAEDDTQGVCPLSLLVTLRGVVRGLIVRVGDRV